MYMYVHMLAGFLPPPASYTCISRLYTVYGYIHVRTQLYVHTSAPVLSVRGRPGGMNVPSAGGGSAV